MHAVLFIQDLAVILLVAGIITILCHRFNQPVVLGYIIAGIILGPYTPPFMFISDERTIRILAELGVIFLMFSLGLEFDLSKLRKVGFSAFVAALAEILLMIGLGYGIGRLFMWSPTNALFLGAILAISSTTIIIKALEDLGMKKERFAHLIFGILIIEDIFAIAILALLSTLATTGTIAFNDIFLALTKLASFLVISLVLGIFLVPKILAYVARFKNKEMLLITALGLCFGFCFLVIKLNYSVALGAFLIGAIMAESKELKSIERLIMPLKDMFSAIFFVSVGLLFNPQVIFVYTLPIVIITVAVVLGKILAGSLGMLITGQNGKTAMRVGMGLAQIGEFSFIIASLGITLNVTGNFLYLIAVVVSAITTLLTPHLIQQSDAFSNFLAARTPQWALKMYQNYLRFLQRFKPSEEKAYLIQLLERHFSLAIVNMFIVIAIFWLLDFLATTMVGVKLMQWLGENLQHTILWYGALVLSLPFLIAIYRKLYAFCLLVIEFFMPVRNGIPHFKRIHLMVSYIIPTAVLIGVLFIIFAITKDSVPPPRLLMFVMIIPAILVIFLLPWFISIHQKLQRHFVRTLSKQDKP